MTNRMQKILTGMAISFLVSATFIQWFIFGTVALKVGVVLSQTPAMLIIGAIIGWVAHSKGSKPWVVVVSAALGWIGGSLLATNLHIILGIQINQESDMVILFYVLQVIFGVLVGLVPIAIAKLVAARRTNARGR